MKKIYSRVFILFVGGVIVNQNCFSSSSNIQNSQSQPQNEDTANHLTRQKVIEIQKKPNQKNHPDVFVVPNEFEVIDSHAFDKRSSAPNEDQSPISVINNIIIDRSLTNNKKLTIKEQAVLGDFNSITFRNTENLEIENQAFIKLPSPADKTSLLSSIRTIEFQNCKFSPNNQGIQLLKDPVDIIVKDMDTIPNHFCSNITINNLIFSRPIKSLGTSCFYGCRLPKDFLPIDVNKIDVSKIPESAFHTSCWTDNGQQGDAGFNVDGNIPDSWEIIGPGAFAYSSLFRSLVKGSNLKEVGDEAFVCMAHLEYVLLSGKAHFGDRVFALNRKLQSVSFGKGSTFGIGIFDGCWHEFIIELPEITYADLQRLTEGLTNNQSGYVGPTIFCPNVDKVTEA